MATKTTAAQPLYDPATCEWPKPGDLVHADPNTLIIGANARTTLRMTPHFKASIKTRGVKTPISAWTNDTGHLVVKTGQRRTLAAIDGDRRAVPVYVVAAPDEIDRLVDQLDENEHRDPMTSGDLAAAYEQLTMHGLSVAQIARKRSTSKDEVTHALRLAASQTARTTVAEHQALTLEQGATIAEFDDDPHAVKLLIQAATDGRFAHKAQELRDQHYRAAYRQDLHDKLTAAAVPIIPIPTYEQRNIATLDALKDRTGKPVDPRQHITCPGHAAFITANGYSNSRDEPYRIVYACTDIKANGHYNRNTDKLRTADMTAEQRAQASAARKDVLASNRAWDSAETVRREWLTTFFARTRPPKNTAEFVALSHARADDPLPTALKGGNEMAAKLLGFTGTVTYGHSAYTQFLTGLLTNATDARAQMLTLAFTLAAYEAGTGRNSWRQPTTATARYLAFLEAHGYELSDVEARACGRAVTTPAPQEPDDAGHYDHADSDTAPSPDPEAVNEPSTPEQTQP